jgi:hypothetical protein
MLIASAVAGMGDVLIVYDLEAKSPVEGINDSIALDFGWLPGKDEFVLTYGNRLSRFRRIVGECGYAGTSIEAPLGVDYTFCAWSPGGTWLAVQCINLRELSEPPHLGLYSVSQNRFVVTKVPYAGYQRCFWTDSETVWVPQSDSLLEVVVKSSNPEVRGKYLLPAGRVCVGVRNREMITVDDSMVLRIGEKILAHIERQDGFSVLVARSFVCVATSLGILAAYDFEGHSLGTADVRSLIQSWAVDENRNAVYGIAKEVIFVIELSSTFAVFEAADG